MEKMSRSNSGKLSEVTAAVEPVADRSCGDARAGTGKSYGWDCRKFRLGEAACFFIIAKICFCTEAESELQNPTTDGTHKQVAEASAENLPDSDRSDNFSFDAEADNVADSSLRSVL